MAVKEFDQPADCSEKNRKRSQVEEDQIKSSKAGIEESRRTSVNSEQGLRRGSAASRAEDQRRNSAGSNQGSRRGSRRSNHNEDEVVPHSAAEEESRRGSAASRAEEQRRDSAGSNQGSRRGSRRSNYNEDEVVPHNAAEQESRRGSAASRAEEQRRSSAASRAEEQRRGSAASRAEENRRSSQGSRKDSVTATKLKPSLKSGFKNISFDGPTRQVKLTKQGFIPPEMARYHLKEKTATSNISTVGGYSGVRDWDAYVSPYKYKAHKNELPNRHGAPYDYRTYLETDPIQYI